jgi:hypothetical protein
LKKRTCCCWSQYLYVLVVPVPPGGTAGRQSAVDDDAIVCSLCSRNRLPTIFSRLSSRQLPPRRKGAGARDDGMRSEATASPPSIVRRSRMSSMVCSCSRIQSALHRLQLDFQSTHRANVLASSPVAVKSATRPLVGYVPRNNWVRWFATG